MYLCRDCTRLFSQEICTWFLKQNSIVCTPPIEQALPRWVKNQSFWIVCWMKWNLGPHRGYNIGRRIGSSIIWAETKFDLVLFEMHSNSNPFLLRWTLHFFSKQMMVTFFCMLYNIFLFLSVFEPCLSAKHMSDTKDKYSLVFTRCRFSLQIHFSSASVQLGRRELGCHEWACANTLIHERKANVYFTKYAI